MTGPALIALINAALAVLKITIPQLKDFVSRGEVSVDDQKKVKDEYESLKARADGQFTGPQWEKSGRS